MSRSLLSRMLREQMTLPQATNSPEERPARILSWPQKKRLRSPKTRISKIGGVRKRIAKKPSKRPAMKRRRC